MNKILLGNEITGELDKIIVDNDKITFAEAGEYEIEYARDGVFNYTFIVNNDIKITEYSFDHNITVNNSYIVNNGVLDIIKFYSNDGVSEKINVFLDNPECTFNYYFAGICRDKENYEFNIYHKSHNTYSNIKNKAVALNNSTIKFVINSVVFHDSVKSVLDQNTRIITLGDANATVKPNMYIDLDDVEAKHGSVIGTFKDDQVFYLMSKGISYNMSLKLLINGFLLSDVGSNYELRKKIKDIVDVYWR